MTALRNAIVAGLLAGLSSLMAASAMAGQTGLIAHFPFDGQKNCYQPLLPGEKEVQCVRVDGREGIRFTGQGHLIAEGGLFDQPSLTISLWFYMDTTRKDEMKLMVRDLGESLQRIFQLQIYNPTQGYAESQIRFLAETSPGGGWEIAAVTESSSILPGSWTHLVVTVSAGDASGPGAVRIWLNGRQERVVAEDSRFATKRSLAKAMQKTTKTSPSPYQLNIDGGLLTNSAIPLFIGTPEGERHNFDGVIDDVRLFDFGLSREEVRSLYRNER